MSFRQSSDTAPLHEVPYKQGDSVWLEQIFGLQNHGSAVQELGSVRIRPNRVIAWPNVLQFRVHGFELKNPAASPGTGTFKVLKFMLVDPNIRITSTANVPPQRMDWCEQEIPPYSDEVGIENDCEAPNGLHLNTQNPQSVKNRIGRCPCTQAEARDFLRQARDDRVLFTHYQNAVFHEHHVDL
jgi:hypothetical protein